MIKLSKLADAAELAAGRRRCQKVLDRFSEYKDGDTIYIHLNGAEWNLRNKVANEIVGLVIADLTRLVGWASDKLAQYGVDLNEEEGPAEMPPAASADGTGTAAIAEYTTAGKPRCVALKPCGSQCFNSAYQLGGLCGVHIRMPIHRRHLGDTEKAALPSP
jgi:hypothetical protein